MKRAKVKIYLSDNPKENRITIDGTDITHAVEGFQIIVDGKRKIMAAGIKGDIWVEGRIPTSLRKLIEPVEAKQGMPDGQEVPAHDTP